VERFVESTPQMRQSCVKKMMQQRPALNISISQFWEIPLISYITLSGEGGTVLLVTAVASVHSRYYATNL
jgi:hypothetical protein